MEDLLRGLASHVNETRNAAEAVLKEKQTANAPQVAVELVQCLRTSADEQVRSLAAVMLRGALERSSPLWPTVPPPLQEQIKAALLEVFITEKVPHIRRKACHTVAELATTCARARQPWPELMKFVLTAVKGEAADLRAVGLTLLRRVLDYVGSGPAVEFAAPVTEALQARFADADMVVRGRAVQAAVSFVRNTPDAARDGLQPMVPAMMETLQALLNINETVAKEVLEAMLELPEAVPGFLRPFIEPCFRAMLAVAKHDGFSTRTRAAAVEFLLTLCDTAADMMRKHLPSITQLLETAASFVVLVGDDPKWVEKEDSVNPLLDEADPLAAELSAVGDGAFDRVAKALGGRATTPIVLGMVDSMSKREEWQWRRAACIILSLVSEGCGMFLMPHVEGLIAMLVGLLRDDPHPRVRYMAAHCLGQFSLDLGELTPPVTFRELTHAQVVPALLDAMGPKHAAVRRIRAHATCSLAHFCKPDVCELKYLPPLESLFPIILDMMTTGGKGCMTDGFTLVACLAYIADEAFEPFAEPFMKLAVQVLSAPATPDTGLLRGKAMECLGMMVNSLTEPTRCAQAPAVMDLLVKLLSTKFDDDDTDSYRCLLLALSRTAEALGPAFEKYRDAVVLPILAAACKKVEVEHLQCDSDEEDDDDDDDPDIEIFYIPELGKRKVFLDSRAVADKQHACKALFGLLDDVGTPLLPRIDLIASQFAPVCQYENSIHIRTAALCSMHRIVNIALDDPADPGHGQKVLSLIISDLMQSLVKERVFNVLCTGAEAFSEVLKACVESERAGIPPEHLPEVFKLIDILMSKALDRRTKAAADAKANVDFDADEAEAFRLAEEAEDDLLTSLVDCVGHLIRQHGVDVLPALNERVLPFATKCLAMRDAPTFRCAALCVFDDVVEHCQPECLKVIPALLPHLEECMSSPDVTVRQSAAYGAGVVAEAGGPHATARLPELVKLLGVILTDPGRAAPETATCTDNAVSAMVKVFMSRSAELAAAGLDLGKVVLGPVLDCLPMMADDVEARFVHGWLVKQLTPGSGGLATVIPEEVQVAKVGAILGAHGAAVQSEAEELLDEEDVGAAFGLLKALVAKPHLQAVWAGLPEPIKVMTGPALGL